jgi:hypothetical protein
MASYRVHVDILDAYNTPRPLLTQTVTVAGRDEFEDFGEVSDHERAIEVLKLVPGAECPFDCDTCRDD